MAININNLQNSPQVKADKTDQLVQRQQTAVQQNAKVTSKDPPES
jgi:negative regulator of flagellin synthesis FlgM